MKHHSPPAWGGRAPQRRESAPGTKPGAVPSTPKRYVTIYHEAYHLHDVVACPNCGTQYARGSARTGYPRLCFYCDQPYTQPPFGKPAVPCTFDEFNRSAYREEAPYRPGLKGGLS